MGTVHCRGKRNIYIRCGVAEGALCSEEWTRLNGDRKIQLENHRFLAIIVLIDSGKDHGWMLKPLVKGRWVMNYSHSLRTLPAGLPMNYQGKGIFTLEKPGGDHLNQVTKADKMTSCASRHDVPGKTQQMFDLNLQ